MTAAIDSDILSSGMSRTAKFEGGDHGSQVSFFLVDNEPGQGPDLHVHPYSETWVIRSGEAEFTVGQDKLRAGAGAILVGPAGIPHKFVNIGRERLELICIHANSTIVQDWVAEEAAA
ncbi:MAG: cupin domain-containing protein [Hyphomicrobiales bacterium]|nr:MAG: cupin domain-containing protein [Hyphomicrobiales bacterium]